MTDEIWLEKYRPSVLEEVQGNPEAINHIKEFARKGNIPNVILTVNLEFRVLLGSERHHLYYV